MATTLQTAHRSTGGKAPVKHLAMKSGREAAHHEPAWKQQRIGQFDPKGNTGSILALLHSEKFVVGYQKSVDLLLWKRPFARIVREIFIIISHLSNTDALLQCHSFTWRA